MRGQKEIALLTQRYLISYREARSARRRQLFDTTLTGGCLQEAADKWVVDVDAVVCDPYRLHQDPPLHKAVIHRRSQDGKHHVLNVTDESGSRPIDDDIDNE